MDRLVEQNSVIERRQAAQRQQVDRQNEIARKAKKKQGAKDAEEAVYYSRLQQYVKEGWKNVTGQNIISKDEYNVDAYAREYIRMSRYDGLEVGDIDVLCAAECLRRTLPIEALEQIRDVTNLKLQKTCRNFKTLVREGVYKTRTPKDVTRYLSRYRDTSVYELLQVISLLCEAVSEQQQVNEMTCSQLANNCPDCSTITRLKNVLSALRVSHLENGAMYDKFIETFNRLWIQSVEPGGQATVDEGLYKATHYESNAHESELVSMPRKPAKIGHLFYFAVGHLAYSEQPWIYSVVAYKKHARHTPQEAYALVIDRILPFVYKKHLHVFADSAFAFRETYNFLKLRRLHGYLISGTFACAATEMLQDMCSRLATDECMVWHNNRQGITLTAYKGVSAGGVVNTICRWSDGFKVVGMQTLNQQTAMDATESYWLSKQPTVAIKPSLLHVCYLNHSHMLCRSLCILL